MLGLHVIEYPTGKYGFVGDIPYDICIWRKATSADIMGNASVLGADGKTQVRPVTPIFDTENAAREYARQHGREVQ